MSSKSNPKFNVTSNNYHHKSRVFRLSNEESSFWVE